MKGLELAREFYNFCAPLLQQRIPDVMTVAAVGLVGEGSECFGCDDALSRDHDWGPGFCFWLPRELLQRERQRIEAAFAALPESFEGMPSRLLPDRRMGRTGPLAIEDFYRGLTGLSGPPQDWREWLSVPEWKFAAAVNGQVFHDGAGIFSRWRAVLEQGYPEDVRLKKMAARCMQMAQSGQYNLQRCRARRDAVAGSMALGRFVESTLSLLFLLNRRYMPFYKWAWVLAGELPVLGASICEKLQRLVLLPTSECCAARAWSPAVEEICFLMAAELRRQGLSGVEHDWLWEHGPALMRHVRVPELLHMDLLQE